MTRSWGRCGLLGRTQAENSRSIRPKPSSSLSHLGWGSPSMSRSAAADALAAGRLRVIDVTGSRSGDRSCGSRSMAAARVRPPRAFGTFLDVGSAPRRGPAAAAPRASGARRRRRPDHQKRGRSSAGRTACGAFLAPLGGMIRKALIRGPSGKATMTMKFGNYPSLIPSSSRQRPASP